MSDSKIFVVLVTFNRLACLQQLLNRLLLQTAHLSEIVIVNNGSTDGTTEWLATQSAYKIITQENTGGAGGFHTGISYAIAHNADWVWLMDDDVLPDAKCLETLLNHTSISSCLHPVHYYADGTMQQEERWFDPIRCTISDQLNTSFNHGKKLWFRNIGSFEGMLISKEIIEKIGFPDKRFFLFHDDLIYGWLASKYTNVCVVADAVIHKQPVKKSVASLYAGLFYSFRNFWLLAEYADKEVSGYRHYRNRRIARQFIYEAYKIFRLREYPNKLKALLTLRKAFKAYRKKEEGQATL